MRHLWKLPARDPFDSLGDAAALSAAADAMLLLRRPWAGSGATLLVAGRDLEETELALDWNAAAGAWTLLGRAGEVHRSQEREKILRLLRESDQPLAPREIAELIGCPRETVKVTLWRLRQRGELAATGGRYRLPPPSQTATSALPVLPVLPVTDPPAPEDHTRAAAAPAALPRPRPPRRPGNAALRRR